MPFMRAGQEPPAKGKGSKISAKMRRFVDEYFVDMNASQACIRAGYKTRSPNKLAAELMAHPLVRKEVEQRMAERREDNEITGQYLLNKLIAIIESADDKTADKLKAIDLAGKSIALWKERQEISGPDGKAIEMEQKVREDVADFTSSLARLAKRGGEAGVVEFPKREGNS